MATILILDDEEDLCRTLEKILTHEGYQVLWTTRASGVLDLIKTTSPSCMILDLRLADSDGFTVLSQVREFDKHLPVIMLTAQETVKTAVEAMKRGAFHYLTKPFDNEELKIVVEKAVEQNRLYQEIENLKKRLDQASDLEVLMGPSEKIREVIKLVQSVAATDISVLLLGESGTGKELVAKAIHQRSDRKTAPFVPVDCASIPDTLIESELFGHERGAFTGAFATQKGKFEMAEGGTLFLDEVGNIPPLVQSKLLRFLEGRIIERVGGRDPIRMDVRVIAATNADLGQSIHSPSGGFRLDLFYRLNEFPIQLPPLRERKEDIPLLCQRFLVELKGELRKEVTEISSEALERLRGYPFPGNVRELRNIIKRALVMAHERIELVDLPLEVRNLERQIFTHDIKIPISYGLPLLEISRQACRQVEKKLILDALRRTQGHQGNAARILGVSQKTLYNKLKELEIHASMMSPVPSS